jgi:PASTA domain
VVKLIAAALVGALIAALLFLAALGLFDLHTSKRGSGAMAGGVTVPNVVGEDLDTAQAKIEALGLDSRGGVCPSFLKLTGGCGPVTGQIPAGGTEVPPDATVTLRHGG